MRNRGAERGVKESFNFQEEADEELVKVGWNGSGAVKEECRWAQSAG